MKSIRKGIAVILVTVLLFVMAITAPAASTVLYGDTDYDGKISSSDALQVLKSVVGKVIFTDQDQEIADVSDNGVVGADDALLILQYVVGKISIFPAAKNQPTPPEDPNPDDPTPEESGHGTVTVVDSLDGVSAYKTVIIPKPIDEDFNTLTQCNVNYSGNYDLDLDCYLAYVYGINRGSTGSGLQNQWKAKKTTYHNDTKIGIMIAFNRDNGEYVVENCNGSFKDVQTTKNGERLLHSQMTYDIYYMVPTKSYLEYKWQAIESYIAAGGVEVVTLEEPEMWNRAGYSEGFKAEYEAYYGEAWQDPSTSAEAMWKNQYFKAHINKYGVEYLSGKIKEKYPEITVLIAAHSSFSYNRHGISTGYYMYASIPTVDGFIGQTWSDDANMSMQYAGEKISDVFMSSLYAYNSYGEAMNDGQSLYLLQDPASDIAGTLEEAVMLARWKETVVAAMMQDDTTSFQSTIWPQRAFDIASDEYKTMQLNINKMYEEFDTLSGANYSGTPGIAIGMSDSMGWHQGIENMVTKDAQDSFSGIFCALQNDGVIVDTVYLDHSDEMLAKQLQEVNLLILPYDVVKPMNPTANHVIADWVRAGGRILFLGGNDAFSNMSIEWWGKQGISPMLDLLKQVGLTEVGLGVGTLLDGTVPEWQGNALDSTCALNTTYGDRTIHFAGSGFETVMKAADKTVGISADVGQGKAVFIGLPSAYYATSAAAEQTLIQMVTLALEGSKTEYTPGAAFVSNRGNYFAYYSPKGEYKTAGDKIYVDLFTPTLKVVTGGTKLAANTAQLYYDVTEATTADIPKVGFVGATEMAERVEKAKTTSCTIAFPSNSQAAVVFFGNGKYPQMVEAYQGTNERKVETVWDSVTGALTVTVPNRNVAKNIEITVTWGNTPSADF
ncbi:MAG: dockerin type I repeat-containing protein [Clostridia bacterium]|nr:dockerin type I repeat-containing protein [Clostridia bacterium]